MYISGMSVARPDLSNFLPPGQTGPSSHIGSKRHHVMYPKIHSLVYNTPKAVERNAFRVPVFTTQLRYFLQVSCVNIL